MSRMKIWKGCDSRGADMGRRNIITVPLENPIKFRLQRLHWVDGAYDEGGAYWGRSDAPGERFVWWAQSDIDTGQHVFVRADTRDQAKQRIQEQFANARFYR